MILLLFISRNMKRTNEPETYDFRTLNIKECGIQLMNLKLIICVLLIVRNSFKYQGMSNISIKYIQISFSLY